MRCSSCVYYRPHPLYQFMGYCSRKESIVPADESCEDVKPVQREELMRSLTDFGWLYCLECGSYLFDAGELEQHLAKGHTLFNSFLEDSVSTEEAYGAD